MGVHRRYKECRTPAIQLGMTTLKARALENLQSQLSGANIVRELFSDFTWRFVSDPYNARPSPLMLAFQIPRSYHNGDRRPRVASSGAASKS